MSTKPDLPLPFESRTDPAPDAPVDVAARMAAVDPRRNVVLEASAGTGKTRVLVDRYLRLVGAGVEPANVLAMTFTRKAAAEMRQRIVAELGRVAAERADAAAGRALADRLGDVAISTIDAFCLSLLREFPLEADVDPAFEVADEAALLGLRDRALVRALGICRTRARRDPDVALLFAQLGEGRLQEGLAALLDRRLVVAHVLARVLRATPRGLTLDRVCAGGRQRLCDALASVEGGLERFLDRGPVANPGFALLAAELRSLSASPAEGAVACDAARLRATISRVQTHVLTRGGTPRRRDTLYDPADYPGPAARRAHWAASAAVAPVVADAIRAIRRDLNAIQARAVWRVFAIALDQYRRELDAHGALDFAGLLERARAMLETMPEFGRSRYLLESRYQHVLVDEFQDTSRVQWDLVRLLVRSWGEGLGVAQDAPLQPSIFIVGDRKQSIYGFRDAEVAVLGDAAEFVTSLRPDGSVAHSISHSFRSAAPLLAFANDLFTEVEKNPGRRDAFRYEASDRFPVVEHAPNGSDDGPVLGLATASTVRACAGSVAAEIVRILQTADVRDRQTGLRRRARPEDIAVLFRTRESHREFERALEALGVPTYVYKGLGFFESDEILDIVAVVRFLADPSSDVRAAALLRSRVARISDDGLSTLAPGLARALVSGTPPVSSARLEAEDRRVFDRLRVDVASWLDLADRLPPAELIDRVLGDSAYAAELAGPRLSQARENVKKLRALIRRLQNRGYLTLPRLAGQVERMSAGDESNAVVDAIDAVNLMTIHAAKGLEFPIVFVVNLARGTGGRAAPIRVAPGEPPADAVSVGDFQAAFDEDATEREREETKRLLYVAVTRARDRLYLSSPLERGRFRPRSGSLGDVVPASVRRLMERAGERAGAADELAWEAESGRVHRFRLCPVPAAESSAARRHGPVGPPEATRPSVDLEPVDSPEVISRRSVTSVTDADRAPGPTGSAVSRRAAAVVGRLVHRLFQRGEPDEPTDSVRRLARDVLLEIGEAWTDDLVDTTATLAADLYRSMRSRPDISAVLDQAVCYYEVPFSLRVDEGRNLLRGIIDCVAVQPDGAVTVVDFKTGAARPADREQLALYERAARALFPGARIDARLVYPQTPDGR